MESFSPPCIHTTAVGEGQPYLFQSEGGDVLISQIGVGVCMFCCSSSKLLTSSLWMDNNKPECTGVFRMPRSQALHIHRLQYEICARWSHGTSLGTKLVFCICTSIENERSGQSTVISLRNNMSTLAPRLHFLL